MTAQEIIAFIVFPVIGYLLGSIPFAWVIGKMNGVDIRTVGSKNIGATNLGRTLGKRFFWQAFLLDAAKGFVPVLIAALVISHGLAATTTATPGDDFVFTDLRVVTRTPAVPSWTPLLTAAACMLGHLFPIWLKFKGGKGVATGFGVVLGFWPLFTLAGLAAGMFFIFMLMVYRYISLASMASALFFAALVSILSSIHNRYFDLYQPTPDRYVLIGVACAFALMIILRHRANITRLLKGTEPKVGQREIDKAKMP